MLTVDLNCDMGEGYPDDAKLMRYISSTNIACGAHAGDEATMRRTVELALAADVKIGAHPGYDDRENFGRRVVGLTSDEVDRLIRDQLSAMRRVCESLGAELHHVKPHGALYNQAAKDRPLARRISETIADFDPTLVVYGLAGSHLISEAESCGLATASEVFADRTYRADGTLTPRSEPNALIEDRAQALDQVMQMLETGTVTATTGETVDIRAETICIHGDGEHAVEFAESIREALDKKLIDVRPPNREVKRNKG